MEQVLEYFYFILSDHPGKKEKKKFGHLSVSGQDGSAPWFRVTVGL